MAEETNRIVDWLTAEAQRMEREAVARGRAVNMPVFNVAEAVSYRKVAAAIRSGEHLTDHIAATV